MKLHAPLLAAVLGLLAPHSVRAGDKPEAESRPAATSHYRAGRTKKIDRIVIHTVEGSLEGAVSTFQKGARRVSAHYVVGKDGALVQCVADEDTAWHAGAWNGRSIGIEHEGFAGKASTWTPALLATSARLTRWLCDEYRIPIDREHIVGHVEVPGATHWDPGSFFDWDAYLALVRGGDGTPGSQPEERVAPVRTEDPAANDDGGAPDGDHAHAALPVGPKAPAGDEERAQRREPAPRARGVRRGGLAGALGQER